MKASTSWWGSFSMKPTVSVKRYSRPRELEAARGRVEGLKEPVPDADLGSGQGVQQGRLAGVGVAGQGDAGAIDERWRWARITPRFRSSRVSRRRSAAIRSRARRRSVSIWLSPGPLVPIPPAESLEVGPQSAHPGQVVFELGQLHLQLALGRVGVVGEDVENHRRAVDHRHTERRLQVALLARRQLVIAGDDVGVAGGDLLL